MKILHVTPYYHPAAEWGGPVRSVALLAEATARAGAEVEVLTTNARGSAALPAVPPGLHEVRGVPVRYCRAHGPRRFFFSSELAREAWRAARGADVVHIHGLWTYPVLAAARACELLGVPYVLSPRGSLDPWALRQKGWKKRGYTLLVERHTLRRAALLHFTTDDEHRMTPAEYRDQPHAVVPNCLELEELLSLERGEGFPVGSGPESSARPEPDDWRAGAEAENSARSEPDGLRPRSEAEHSARPELVEGRADAGPTPLILMLGRIHPMKGFDLIVPALRRLADAGRRVDLAIAGGDEGGYQRTVERLVREHGLVDRVRFLGEVGGERKKDALRRAALLAAPSYRENFGNAIAEAMAAGLPVVVSERVGIAQDIAEVRAGLVVPLEPVPLAEAIGRLLDDAPARAAMGEHGRELVRTRYSGAAVAEAMLTAYARAARFAAEARAAP